ncbi:Ribonuclease H [Pseudocercospora fuligena]|uniref:Ribonuclease H n=1 Tax=Pseudocercospora fuligena TaxID=685502 RepID=A0A8H6VP82_9PEZI|nr:Ribonuclease H [Pseudocercospora fuligena]
MDISLPSGLRVSMSASGMRVRLPSGSRVDMTSSGMRVSSGPLDEDDSPDEAESPNEDDSSDDVESLDEEEPDEEYSSSGEDTPDEEESLDEDDWLYDNDSHPPVPTLSYGETGLGPLPDLPLKKAAVFDVHEDVPPSDLFVHEIMTPSFVSGPHYRFVHRSNDREILIYVSGFCLDPYDVEEVTAGFASVAKPDTNEFSSPGNLNQRLELKGPSGETHPPTTQRAEIRAALGALHFRAWAGEGWHSIVLATDSEGLHSGITKDIEYWVANNWKTEHGQPVKDRDMWEALLDFINDSAERGLKISFWKIASEYNEDATQAAIEAAINGRPWGEFTPISGIMA